MSDDIFKPGQRFDKYVIERQIGKGGQGEVYLGRHAFTTKRVAVKVLPMRKSNRPDYRERLTREARVMGTVEHPNIVAIHDGGVTGENTVFIVMEYLDGLLLRDLLFRQGVIDLTTALAYTCSITGAITALHRARILHRDLKPENVFVLPGGIIKVIDFGLARLRDNAARTTVRMPNGDKPGIMGTPHYMSPEQLLGENVGEQADVYAIGLIFYEMVTGKHVFQRSTGEFPTHDAVTIQHHAMVPRLLGEVTAGIPDDLSRLVARCLAKDPAERPTAAELGAELRAILDRVQRRAARAESGRPRAAESVPSEPEPALAIVAREPSAPPSALPSLPPGRGMPPRLNTVRLPHGYRPQDPSTWTIGTSRKERTELPYAATEEIPPRQPVVAAVEVARPSGATAAGRGSQRVETLEPITTVRARRSRSRIETLFHRMRPVVGIGIGLGLSLSIFLVAAILWRTLSARSSAALSAAGATSASAAVLAPATAPASATAMASGAVSAAATTSATGTAPEPASPSALEAPPNVPIGSAPSAPAGSPPAPRKRAPALPKRDLFELSYPSIDGPRAPPAPSSRPKPRAPSSDGLLRSREDPALNE